MERASGTDDRRLTDAAHTLEVPYQRLRRLELGTRTDPELVHLSTTGEY